jgi:excisionase family DNA binding protein
MDYNKGVIKETEFFTTSELAKKLKMNVQVITRKIQAGEIFAYKIGKDWRIPEYAVFEWLENRSNGKNGKSNNNGGTTATKPAGERPVVRSNRKYLLEYILAQFEPSKEYSEDEVNRIIARYHDDYRSVRQEFVSEKMMEHVGSSYRRRAGYKFSD